MGTDAAHHKRQIDKPTRPGARCASLVTRAGTRCPNDWMIGRDPMVLVAATRKKKRERDACVRVMLCGRREIPRALIPRSTRLWNLAVCCHSIYPPSYQAGGAWVRSQRNWSSVHPPRPSSHLISSPPSL